MLELLSESNAAALVGLIGGVVLGLAARIGRFCTLGAIEDALYGGDDTRLRMWGLAIGVAILGSFALTGLGIVDLRLSLYLSAPFSPVTAILGGLLFGYGMALAGNCGYGALARLGGGDMRNFVILLVIGISAMIAANGPLAEALQAVSHATALHGAETGIAHFIAGQAGLPVWLIGVVIGAAIIVATVVSASFRRNPSAMFWGAAVGLAVILAWAGTGWIATHGFGEVIPSSHSFAAPIGRSMIYAMTASAGGLDFAVGSVAGVLLGAFAGSLFKGHFRWEACDDPRELRRQIIGAALMGVGAVLALGCSIGQGLSGFSVLAVSAPIVLMAILAGAALGLRQIMFGLTWIN